MWRMGRKIHSSWLIAISGLGLIISIFASQFIGLRFFSLWWLVCGVTAVAVTFLVARKWTVPLLMIGAVMIGLWRASGDLVVKDSYLNLVGTTVQVTGIISEDPVKKPNIITFPIQVETLNDQPSKGAVYVTSEDEFNLRRGDTVLLKGKLQQAFGSYYGALYRADITAAEATHDAVVDFRDWFSARVRNVISEPAASLGMGFLIGEKSQLPSDLTDALQVAGLTHVIVASGYNLTILVRLARRLLMRVSKFAATLASVLLVIGFIGVTGMSPSMSRAGMVTALSLAAWYYGRRFHPFVLLCVVAAVSVMVQPNYIWNDVGWALSFAAFIGVMVAAPLFQKYFFGQNKPGVIRQILGETVAAHLLTLPIILLVFSQLSHVAVLTNMLVLPLVPLAMLLTFLCGVLSLVSPPLVGWLGWACETLLGYMIEVVYFFSDLPWAKSDIGISVGVVAVIYLFIAGILLYIRRVTGHDLREANVVE